MKDIVDKFKGIHAFVIGDPIVDVYHFGHITKLSQEAPIPVFVEDKVEQRPGGAGNVVRNLAALGCNVGISFNNVQPSFKHRYVVGQHQVFRHDQDFISDGKYHLFDVENLKKYQVLVLSDYAKGAVSTSIAQTSIAICNSYNIPVVVDPKGSDWSKYAGCTVICPNHFEALEKSCQTEFENVIVKKGENGMSIWTQNNWSELPARAHHVFDPCGAGDVVTAVVAATLGAGIKDIKIAAELASVAAGWSVGEIGTVAVTADKLKELL